MNDISAINLFLEAGLVVKSVMLILLLISIISWIIIFERYLLYRKIKNLNIEFENRFWSGEDLNILYEEVNNDQLIHLRLFGLLELTNEFSNPSFPFF